VEFFLQTQNTFAPFAQVMVLCFSICLKLFPVFWLCSKKKKMKEFFLFQWWVEYEKEKKKITLALSCFSLPDFRQVGQPLQRFTAKFGMDWRGSTEA